MNSSTPRNYQHVTRQKKNILLYFFTKLKTNHLSYFYLYITLLTLLILTVCRRYVIWTSWWTSLTMESLWLRGRALECGIQRSEVQFLMVTHNFFFLPCSWKDKKNILLYVTSLINALSSRQVWEYSNLSSRSCHRDLTPNSTS